MMKKPSSSAHARPRIGLSRCLLGDHVRYDGSHKYAPFLLETLSSFVEWVPVCPEVEVGMGVPREPIRLVGSASAPRFVTIDTGKDYTAAMRRFSRRRIRELEALDLSGYVFKSESPSCGMEGVRVLDAHGRPSFNGVGIFARAFITHFPLLPAAEEEHLRDQGARDHFLEQLFAYHRWRRWMRPPVTRRALLSFHEAHQPQLLAHSLAHANRLDRLIARADRDLLSDLAPRYGLLFMQALRVPPGHGGRGNGG